MKLFIIQTVFGTYSTNGENDKDARKKFNEVYPGYSGDIISVEEIKPEELENIENNDDIIFF